MGHEIWLAFYMFQQRSTSMDTTSMEQSVYLFQALFGLLSFLKWFRDPNDDTVVHFKGFVKESMKSRSLQHFASNNFKEPKKAVFLKWYTVKQVLLLVRAIQAKNSYLRVIFCLFRNAKDLLKSLGTSRFWSLQPLSQTRICLSMAGSLK